MFRLSSGITIVVLFRVANTLYSCCVSSAVAVSVVFQAFNACVSSNRTGRRQSAVDNKETVASKQKKSMRFVDAKAVCMVSGCSSRSCSSHRSYF